VTRAIVLALIGLAIATILAAAGQRLFNAGIAHCQAERAKAADKVAAETDRRDAAASGASIDMLDYLSRSMPAIEATTHETRERVRVIYRNNPVPAGACARPAGVQAELDAARQRAEAARGALSVPAGAGDPAHPGAG
jgi:hypothetical protein